MEQLDLRSYFALLIKWLWLFVLGTVLVAGTAYAVSSNLVPVYEATATLLLEQGNSRITTLTLGGSQWEPATYAALLPKLLGETAARLSLDAIDPEGIAIEPVRDTRVLTLRVRDHSPRRAADIANTIPLVFAEYSESLLLDRFGESKTTLSAELERLETEIADTEARIQDVGEVDSPAEEAEVSRLETVLSQNRYNYGQILAAYEQVRMAEMDAKGNLVVFRQAEVPTSPVLPRTRNNTLLGAVAGALLAAGIAFLVEYLDDRLKTPEQVNAATGLATLGSIALLPNGRRQETRDPLVTITEPRSPTAESFRVLRTNVQYSSLDRPIGRLLVTSPSPANGKSFLAANLAVAFAQAGRSVVLVDCDLRRPSLHKMWDISASVGLTDALVSQDGDNPGDVDRFLQPTPVKNLRILASGPLPPNPAEMAGSRRMGEFVAHLAQQVEVVILDSPPVLAATDAAVLSRQADGVLIVVEAARTRKKEVARALEDLSHVEAPLLGAVLNKIPLGRHGSYGYSYYHYAYQEAGGRKRLLLPRFLGAWRRRSAAHQPAPARREESDASQPTSGVAGGE